jgi:hypothetical protein
MIPKLLWDAEIWEVKEKFLRSKRPFEAVS